MSRAEWKAESRRVNMFEILSQPIGLTHYLVVGAVMFVAGAVCMATKRNALGVLMGIELVLNGANLNFVAFGSNFLERNPDVPARPGWTDHFAVCDCVGRRRSGGGFGDRVELLQQSLDRRCRSGR